MKDERLRAWPVTPVTDPEAASGSTASLYLPRHTMAIDPKIAISRHLELRLSIEDAFAAESIPLGRTDPRRLRRFPSPLGRSLPRSATGEGRRGGRPCPV